MVFLDSVVAVDFAGERLQRGRPSIAEDIVSSDGQCGGVVVLSSEVEVSSWVVQRRWILPLTVAAASWFEQCGGGGVL